MDNPFAPELLIESRGAVRIVTLNRPEHLNATNEALHGALIKVWRHLAEDLDARAVVLTGAGKAFSAGGDFDQIKLGFARHAHSRINRDDPNIFTFGIDQAHFRHPDHFIYPKTVSADKAFSYN